MNCGDPGSPRNGSSVVTGSRYQDTVTYACNTGYNITGDVTRTCLATRLWSGALPTCWCNFIFLYMMLETEHNCIFHPPNIGNIFIQSFNNTDSISCSSSPCLNGATCINTLGGFKCQCGPGWAGDICQTGKEEELLFVSRFLNTDTNNNNSWILAQIFNRLLCRTVKTRKPFWRHNRKLLHLGAFPHFTIQWEILWACSPITHHPIRPASRGGTSLCSTRRSSWAMDSGRSVTSPFPSDVRVLPSTQANVLNVFVLPSLSTSFYS